MPKLITVIDVQHDFFNSCEDLVIPTATETLNQFVALLGHISVDDVCTCPSSNSKGVLHVEKN